MLVKPFLTLLSVSAAALMVFSVGRAEADTGFYGPTPDEQTLTPDERAHVEAAYADDLRSVHINWRGSDAAVVQGGRAVCDDLGPRYKESKDYVSGLVIGGIPLDVPGALMPHPTTAQDVEAADLFVTLTISWLCPSVDGRHYTYPWKHDAPRT